MTSLYNIENIQPGQIVSKDVYVGGCVIVGGQASNYGGCLYIVNCSWSGIRTVQTIVEDYLKCTFSCPSNGIIRIT